jgi:hypothetical protein
MLLFTIMKQPSAPRVGNGRNHRSPAPQNNSAKKQTIFQSRRRDTQKPLIDNSNITGMIPETFDGIFKVGKNASYV